MRKLMLVVPAIFLTACASITSTKFQGVIVKTVQNDKEIANADCTLTNDAGQWRVTTPGIAEVHKSTADIVVDCKTADATGQQKVASKANSGAWGNLNFGGITGIVIDSSTGAGFDYPNLITVVMNKIGETVAMAAKTEKAAEASKPQ